MNESRIFDSRAFLQPADDEPIRSVVTESEDAVVVAWYVKPGQSIKAHVHPNGQDTWTVLAGTGLYQTDAEGPRHRINVGDIAVARAGNVHGVRNDGAEALVFISVVCPVDAGYELLQARPFANRFS